MILNAPEQAELSLIYQKRFSRQLEQRRRVWQVLVKVFFQRLVPADSVVLDLGCGYGEFINHVQARVRYGMDLNPDAALHLDDGVKFLEQDCSQPWNLPDGSLDVVFTSNFFEHLPNKECLARTLDEVRRCLRPGTGRLIAMGPNIRYVNGAYWDFWDHHLALSERSLGEALENRALRIERSVSRFLPYTMVGKKESPGVLIEAYLRMPWLWRLFGKQFLVIAGA